MAFLVHNLPPVEVYVKKEYLYDHQKGHGELTPGVWISIRSIQSKALYFETLLTEYGALYDKLPISAFVWKEDFNPEDQLPFCNSTLFRFFLFIFVRTISTVTFDKGYKPETSLKFYC